MNKPDRLYNLLPVAYRQRDAEQGSPLQMLLRVIAEQVDLVEKNISQLYDNWFIETCEDWVVPYIGDLIGYRPVHEAGETEDVVNGLVNKILVPRREVANTIRYRRRKGTLSLLQELSFAVAGWPARAVEFSQHLGAAQNVEHVRERRAHVVDLRDAEALDLLGTPFDGLSHGIDISSVNSPNAQGKYNIPSVGLFVWRLRVYSATHTPAFCLEDAGDHCYTFSILGNDMPLYTKVEPQKPTKQIPSELNLPTPIRRRAFEEREGKESHASHKYYGEDKSVAIWAAGWAETAPDQPIPAEKIIPADLSEWKYRPKTGQIAVDPQLGRIAFPPGQLPEGDVFVSYHYGFSAEIGGGEYPRPITGNSGTATTYSVGSGREFSTIRDAYEKWLEDKPPHGVIEIADSGVYEEQIHIEMAENQTLELRAANEARPIMFLVDWHASRPDALTVSGAAGSTFSLDGILITGRGIEIKGNLDRFNLRHCTLVPGWALHPDCRPRRANEPSLALVNTSAHIQIEHSILGPIQVIQEDDDVDPLSIQVTDSILDATHSDSRALAAPDDQPAPAVLTMRRCTVFGRVVTHAILLAENSIFTGHILVARRQLGCIRFCYVPPGSRTPKRYHCQPDLVDQAVADCAQGEQLSHEDAAGLRRAERFRVEPEFASTHYGNPNYGQLASNCAAEINTGADDRSELGAFHDLYQPQRQINLRARLEEYTPAGIDAEIIFAS